MSLAGRMKRWFNTAVAPVVGVRLESTTGERLERERLENLARNGHFDRPIYPVPKSFSDFDPCPMVSLLARHAAALDRLRQGVGPSDFTFENTYFTSPDAEVAYCLVREHRPRRILEIGAGNSTRLFRAAIRDGSLDTELVSIDPDPRVDLK